MGPNPLGLVLDLRASQPVCVCVCLRYTTHLFKGFFLFFSLYTNVEILFSTLLLLLPQMDGWLTMILKCYQNAPFPYLFAIGQSTTKLEREGFTAGLQ